MLGIGQSLGNYRIVGKLGHGAMGVVYEAELPASGARVALKVIHRDLAKNHEVVTRFLNEARAVHQIGNPHVVDVADFGQTDEGEHFMVMEVLAGESLADRLERERRLTIACALHIAGQLADGLAAAHAAGVVHRDLKPDNVFLVEQGGDRAFVKILDFGLAKLMLDGRASVTKEGVILGTPEYMSPEQAESKKTIDHRSDVYALGILLYQMVTGLLPFVGHSMGEVLVKHVSRLPAPPRSVRADVPEAVERVILKCLAKRPEDRYQSMAELGAALVDPEAGTVTATLVRPARRTLPGTGTVAVVPAPPRADAAATATMRARRARRWWPVALAAGAAVVGAGGLWMARPAKTPPRATVPAATAAPAPLPAPAPPSVRIVVNTNPPAAEIFDESSGQRLGVSPVELSLPRDSGPHALVIRHPGFGEKHRLVGTQADAELTLDLAPEGEAPAPAAGARAPKP